MAEFRSNPDPWNGITTRLRVDVLAEEGPPPLLDHSEHLLQLRVGVRNHRLRRQGHARRQEESKAILFIPAAAGAVREGVVTP